MSGKPLSILHVLTHHKVNAGGAIQAYLLARELARLGHRVTLAFGERSEGTSDDTRRRVEEIGCCYAGLRLRSIASIRDLRALLRQGYDVVHLHRELALQRFVQAAPFSPPVGAVANVGTSKVPTPARARRLRSRRVDRIVVVAEALKRLLVCTARVDPARIHVVYGAFDEERFRPDAEPLDVQAEFGLPAGARLIGLVANLDPKKGHRLFVRAAAQVAAQRDDCWFLCAGKGPVARLRKVAAEAGLASERLLFLGFREDVPRLLKTLDVSVCASTKGEGLTGAIRESLAMGTPVISTAVAGNVEIVRQRETGLLVPPGDASALARAMIEVLDDPRQARERAARGCEEVRRRFTSRRRAEEMAAIYQEIVAYREVRKMSAAAILYPEVT
ncbi:MAG: glycosyltransferase family 4 protein [Planctomycetes bacterium]|nr:glycosyltransferase family 4 protein [Planctomycetota bacterium]